MSAALAACLVSLGNILGLLQTDPETYFRESAPVQDSETQSLAETEIEELLARRIAAREASNWTEADSIRDQLDAAGVVIEDGSDGTTWRRK